jgi:pantoate--beta-alanine ligase
MLGGFTMIVVEKIAKTREIISKWKKEGYIIGFVPTMGYLHKGHTSLIEIAKKHSDKVVVSIFVNPIQFNDKNDYLKYPRDIERDKKILEKMGVSLLFIPDEKEMYPNGELLVYVDVRELDKELCGKYRKGHFRGVVSVVSKLFNIIQPDIAVFGKKDIQQAIIIKRMVEDLNYDIKIILGETIREEDGLAISSRNVRLNEEARKEAPSLYKALMLAYNLFKEGNTSSKKLVEAVSNYIKKHSKKAVIEYVELVDGKTLQKKETANTGDILALAVYYDDVRLIDNVILK